MEKPEVTGHQIWAIGGLSHLGDLMFLKKTVASGQDGDIGRHTVPPCTTKRRTTTILKQKTNRTDRKLNHGSLTTKEIKKKNSSRLVGGVETCSWGGEDSR